MHVLALDTATPAVVVGVVDTDLMSVRAAETVRSGNRHAETLGELIPAVLRTAGVSMAELSAIIVGLGPGPFTGLRVGIVTAAALGDALGVPVYGVCSHDAIAAAYLARTASDPLAERFAVVTDARRRECYWADYDGSGTRIAGPQVQRPVDIGSGAHSALGLLSEPPLSDDASPQRWPGRTEQWRRDGLVIGDPAFTEALGVEIRPAQPDPVGLVLAAKGVTTGAAPEPLEPMYLRRPDATPPTARKPVTPALR